MLTKQIILTSSGLQNVVLSKYQDDDDFVFVFGEQDFAIKSFFVVFISPVVSHLHKTDPAIHTINFGEQSLHQKSFHIFNKYSVVNQLKSMKKKQLSSDSFQFSLVAKNCTIN